MSGTVVCKRAHFDPAASAAALALVPAVLGLELHPWFPEGRWLDGTLNVWLITFAVAYVVLVVVQAATGRAAPLLSSIRRPRLGNASKNSDGGS